MTVELTIGIDANKARAPKESLSPRERVSGPTKGHRKEFHSLFLFVWLWLLAEVDWKLTVSIDESRQDMT
jgi:hypothetical protein